MFDDENTNDDPNEEEATEDGGTEDAASDAGDAGETPAA